VAVCTIMEVDADIVTFIWSDGAGVSYRYFESDTGVACAVDDGDYSIRLRGGYYTSGLKEGEVVLMLTGHSHLLKG
jgi:hypothetical protein